VGMAGEHSYFCLSASLLLPVDARRSTHLLLPCQIALNRSGDHQHYSNQAAELHRLPNRVSSTIQGVRQCSVRRDALFMTQ
jgi:hypothetical protein